jgi:hypothetical protein
MATVPEGVREVEDWLSPSEAGRELGTSGTWVTRLARNGELVGVRTSLGWLVDPKDVKRLARKRSAKKASTRRAREVTAAV